ncbi:putative phosphoesterase [Leptospirillum ferriphilum]|uniref:Putative phosphoesterase n=1 Tax=Leptospirillum ferriphilum TaxID=178606 RepID=A0A094WAA4_9BACT|nr:metallophosphoesterase [Leptospirillum ferriphilum]KGA94478.1 putative phosphoesterase [Leptospirillum ferriphilum]
MRIRTFIVLVFGGYTLLEAGVAAWLGHAGVSSAGIGIYLFLTLAMPFYLRMAFSRNWPRPLWLMPLFFGHFFLSGMFLLCVALLDMAGHFFHLLGQDGWASKLLSPIFQAKGVAALAVLILGAVVVNRFRGPAVHRRRVEVPGLAPELAGFRILQVSDVHVGMFESSSTLQSLRRTIESNSADLLVFTGDMIDRRLTELDRFLSFFGDLSAPEGVYCVLGNHEYWIDGPAVKKRLEENGWGVLENRSVPISRGSRTLFLVGISDPASEREDGTGGPDPAKAFQNVHPENGDMVVVLAHNPGLWNDLRPYPATLTLSGHTHGGQIGFPWGRWSLATLFYDFDRGLFRREEKGVSQWLLVNVGTGYFGVPVRLGVSSAVELVTLVSL